MMKILIADDHDVIREGVVSIISSIPDMTVLDEATDKDQLLDLVKNNSYDVILLDVNMPNLNGMKILKQLNTLQPGVSILILTMFSDRQYLKRALNAGASGYLPKENVSEYLVDAIRKVNVGERYISPEFAGLTDITA